MALFRAGPLVAACLLLAVTTGCGLDDEGAGDYDPGDALTADLIDETLADLPYEFQLREVDLEGAEHAVTGRAVDPDGGEAQLSISICPEDAMADVGCPLAPIEGRPRGSGTYFKNWGINADDGERLDQSPAEAKDAIRIASDTQGALCDAVGASPPC
jgi:hypothetical protein